MHVYLGADWSASELACALLVADGHKVLEHRKVGRTPQEIAKLIEWVRRKSSANAVIHVIIEDGSEGWARMLYDAGVLVHVVNTIVASTFAASMSASRAKDDKRDAVVLANLGRSPAHCPPVWTPPDPQHTRLVVLSRTHETITEDCGRSEQRLRALLREGLPSLEAKLEDLSMPWVLKLLRAIPTVWHARALDEAGVRKVLEGSGTRATTRDKVVEALGNLPTSNLDEATAKAMAHQVYAYIDQIELFSKQLAQVEDELDACTADLKVREQLESVGGIGVKMANRILRFTLNKEPAHRDEAAIQLGAAPVFRGSARTDKGQAKGTARLRKSVDPYARSTAYLLGRLTSQQLPWAKAMYKAGRERGQTAATAYRRVARSMLRILTAMVRTGEAYDDARYVASLKAKGVPWAQALAA